MNRGKVYVKGISAGIIERDNGKFHFIYDNEYLSDPTLPPVSLTLPKSQKEFYSDILFPFFFGLLAEGELKEIQCQILKIDESDHFTRLLKTVGADVIGSVTVEEIQ